ncbi:MAG: hypothetical protein HKN73_03955 [Gemmatimonadetes bacterium]|nr:hypothetical protein [Gemmatimonadota bacterium]
MGAAPVLHLDLACVAGGQPVLSVERTSAPLLFGVVATAVFSGLAAGQEAPTGGPLTFLEPLIGTWTGDSAWVAENPGMENLIPISFRWGPTRYSIIDQAALPVRGQLYTVSQITWNPTTRRAEFIATQSNDSLAFTGYYEPLGDRDIRRTYDVHYPDGSVVPFRETFFFVSPDVFDWLTEWNPEGRWIPRRGTGDPEFRMRRRLTDVAEEMAALRPWVGDWAGGGEDRRSVVIAPTGGGSAFRLTAAQSEQGRQGLVVWDPNAVGVRSVEVEGDGALLHVAWSFDGAALVRIVDRFDTHGRAQRWIERWVPDEDPGCFVATRETPPEPAESTRYCRAIGDESGAGG